MKKIIQISVAFLVLMAFGLPQARGQVELLNPTGNDFPLDIVWSTDTYVPPGFGVKALPAPSSSVNLVALTPTKSSSRLNYFWIIEDSSYLGQGAAKQGVGEDSFIFFTRPNIPGFIHQIKVIARDTITGTESTARVEVPVQRPEVSFYFGQQHHARRISNQFVGTPGSQGMIFAKPFYFNVGGIENILFSWMFDGQPTNPSGEPQSLDVFVNPNTATGIQKTLLLNAQNRTNDRERAQAQTSLLIVPSQ